MAAPPGSTPAGSMTYKGKTIPLYQKPLNDGTGRIGIYDGNGTRYRTISGRTDFLNQVDPNKTGLVNFGTQEKAQLGVKGATLGLSTIPAGGAASIATPLSTGTAATATGVGVATTAGLAVGAAIAPAAVLTGILSLTGKRPFESNLTAPIFGAEKIPGAYPIPPAHPGYKGAEFKGGRPVADTLPQGQESSGLEAKAAKQIAIPDQMRGHYKQEQRYKNGFFQLDNELKKRVGISAPRGTLYPNFTSVTRYSDKEHGSQAITYNYPGPQGELVIKELPGGMGLTNLGRVVHKERNKWGIPTDFDGEKTKAYKTAYYAARAYRTSNGKIDPKQATAAAEERAEQEWQELNQKVKPLAVAWGRHDNPIDSKTAQQLIRAAESRQVVWNQAENEWQDANLGLKVDQKAAWKRWETTRPAGYKNDKPRQGSVVDFVSNQDRTPIARISNHVETNELQPPTGNGWRPDGQSGASRPLYIGGKQTGYQVWKDGKIETYGSGTWNDTVAQRGPGIPPLVGVSDAAAELVAKKKAEEAARMAAEKQRKEKEEARQRAAALVAAQNGSDGGSGSGGSGSGIQGSGTPTTDDDLKTTKLGGKAPAGITGKVASTKTNHVTGVKTYLMEDGKIISHAPDGRPYLAGYDNNQVLVHQQQEQAKASTAALLSRGGSIGDWGAAATMAKEKPTSATPHKPGEVVAPSAGQSQPKYDYPQVDYATDIRDKAEILGDQPTIPITMEPQEAASTYALGAFTNPDYGSMPKVNNPAQVSISKETAQAAGLPDADSVDKHYAITDFSNPDDGPFPKLKQPQVSISKVTAEAAQLPGADLVDKHYAITDPFAGSKTDEIFKPAPDNPTEIIPAAPGENVTPGSAQMY